MQQAMPKVRQHVCSVQATQPAEGAGLLVRCTADNVLHEIQRCYLQCAGGTLQTVACWRQKSWPALLCNAALWWPLFLLKVCLHQQASPSPGAQHAPSHQMVVMCKRALKGVHASRAVLLPCKNALLQVLGGHPLVVTVHAGPCLQRCLLLPVA